MKHLILILFFPFCIFGQADTVITKDLGYVVDTFYIDVSGGDTTVFIAYFNEDETRKDEVVYYEQAPSAKASIELIYNEYNATIPQMEAGVEAIYEEYQRRNTALINRRRETAVILDILETFFGY